MRRKCVQGGWRTWSGPLWHHLWGLPTQTRTQAPWLILLLQVKPFPCFSAKEGDLGHLGRLGWAYLCHLSRDGDIGVTVRRPYSAPV